MNKEGEFSLVAKYGCHCAYTNEKSDNGNQKATSEYGVFSNFTLPLVC